MKTEQTLVQVSRDEMKNILSEVNTPQFISFESKTPQSMNKFLDYWLEIEGLKKKNPNPTPNPFLESGIVNHQVKIDIVTGFDYENSVNSRREKEGKETDFEGGFKTQQVVKDEEGKVVKDENGNVVMKDREVWFDVISKGLVTDKKTRSKYYLRYQYTERSHTKENTFIFEGNSIEREIFEGYLIKKNTDSYSNQGLDNTLNFQVCDLRNILTITMNHHRYILTD